MRESEKEREIEIEREREREGGGESVCGERGKISRELERMNH